MGIIKILLIVIEVVCSILLIGLILLQRAKGDGMGLAFGAVVLLVALSSLLSLRKVWTTEPAIVFRGA